MSETLQSMESRQGEAGQYLSFSLEGEEYGVDILKVQEIKGWEPVRSLPDTPDYIKGVLDLRGTIVPIIDLRLRFGFAEVAYRPTTVTIILRVQAGDRQLTAGIVVDNVSDVLDVAVDAIRQSPDLGSRINTRYIQGMVTLNERMVVLLDTDRLLDPDELSRIS